MPGRSGALDKVGVVDVMPWFEAGFEGTEKVKGIAVCEMAQIEDRTGSWCACMID
jgi:hypothetical protein